MGSFFSKELLLLALALMGPLTLLIFWRIWRGEKKASWAFLLVLSLVLQAGLSWQVFTFQKKDLAVLTDPGEETRFLEHMEKDARFGILHDPSDNISSYYDLKTHPVDLNGNLPLFWNAKTVGAAALNFPIERFEKLWGIEKGNRGGIPTKLVGMETSLYDRMGMRYLLTRNELAHPGYSQMLETPSYFFYLNRKVYPRFRCVGEIQQATAEEIREKLLESNADPYGTVYIESQKAGEAERLNQALTGGKGPLRILQKKEGYNRLNVLAAPEKAVFVVTTNAYSPNWKLRVDKKPREIYLCDTYFLGFFLEAGLHRIEFHYDPISFKLGRILSCLALLALAFLGFARFQTVFHRTRGERK
jgi:hypothetical protein